MNPAMVLAPRLALARVRSRRGSAVLDVLAVLAFAVSAYLALTVVGGTRMFFQRWQHPTDEILAALNVDADEGALVLQVYVVLALIACALLVVPVLSLGGAAARLGARGRELRLAALRLVGMTGGQVVAMSALETLVQALLGAAVGTGLWFATLPAWGAVSFHGTPVAAAEMAVPWWLVLLVVAVLLALAVIAAVAGLRRVRISPLGVVAQHAPRGLRARRAAVFVVVLIAFVVFSQLFGPNAGAVQLRTYMPLVVMILLVVGAVNLVGPWLLQVFARLGVATGSPARLVATRRIIDDPRGAWRNVSAVALLGMIAAFMAILPTDEQTIGDDPGAVTVIGDLQTGAFITLAFGLVVAAVSTLMSQAALVLERAEESVSMDRAGMPRTLPAAIRRRQVLMPMALTLALSIGIGFLLASPLMSMAAVQRSGIAVVAATVLVGMVLTWAAAEACRPLEARILDNTRRPND